MTLNACKAIRRIVRAELVDMENGEVLEGVPILCREPSKHYWGETFVTLFQEALEYIARDLNGEESRMLINLIPSLGMNNEWKVLNQRELAAKLRMSQPQVSRVLSSLAKKQIITKGTRIGKGHAYTLNPYFGWKGDFRNHAPAKKEAPKLRLVHSAGSVAA